MHAEYDSTAVLIRGALRHGACVDNITGLQLALSFPPWSDGKGKGQFTFQGG